MTVCKNEERIMPFFIKHYEPWVDEILIIDGGSTDGGLKIAQELGNGKVKISRAEYDDGKYVNDLILQRIRNEEWKTGIGEFDWMIVCDNDELLYHPDILTKLKEYKDRGITLPNVAGYQMMSRTFPNPETKITEQVKHGYYCESYNKNVIFDCKKINHMKYGPGSHGCEPTGHVEKTKDRELKLLHYRMLGYEYHIDKAGIAAKNLEPTLLKERRYGHHNIDIVNKYTPQMFEDDYNKTDVVI